MNEGQYWAQVGARIASGEKIDAGDAMVGLARATQIEKFYNSGGSSSSSSSGGGGGSVDSLGVILLVLIAIAIFLFIGCPYLAWTRLGQGKITSGLIYLLLAVISYGGIAYWIWYDYNEKQMKVAEEKRIEAEQIELTKARILDEYENQIKRKEERLASEQRKVAKIIHEKREIINQAKNELDALKAEQDEIRKWNEKHGSGQNLETALTNLRSAILKQTDEKILLEKQVNEIRKHVESFEKTIDFMQATSIDLCTGNIKPNTREFDDFTSKFIAFAAVLLTCDDSLTKVKNGEI